MEYTQEGYKNPLTVSHSDSCATVLQLSPKSSKEARKAKEVAKKSKNNKKEEIKENSEN
jgi:hypothetical protein